jgi:hypothetical protein
MRAGEAVKNSPLRRNWSSDSMFALILGGCNGAGTQG